MPNFNTHITVGGILAVIYAILCIKLDVNIITFLIGIITIPIFSILPDIDQPISKIRKVFNISGFLSAIILIILHEYIIAIIILILFIFLSTTKHRGILHSPFICIFLLLFAFYSWLYTIFACLSFLSHIMLDKTIRGNNHG